MASRRRTKKTPARRVTTKVKRAWIVIFEAPDVPGHWIAYCLDIDILSGGSSPAEALDMLYEAIGLVFEDEIARGRNPLDRKPAPAAEWKPLRDLLHGDPDLGTIDELGALSKRSDVETIALQTMLFFDSARARRYRIEPIPAAMMAHAG